MIVKSSNDGGIEALDADQRHTIEKLGITNSSQVYIVAGSLSITASQKRTFLG